jgi:hypothetical protein
MIKNVWSPSSLKKDKKEIKDIQGLGGRKE